MMVDSQARDGQDPELTLLPVAVRATGRDGVAGGVGFFIASDLVSTCAHAVSDAPGPPCVALADVGSARATSAKSTSRRGVRDG